MLISGEAMLRAGFDEDCCALFHGNLLAFDLEDARALEDHVQLVVVMGLLSIWLRGHEAVDTGFEAGGLMDDLVSTTGLP